MSFLRAPNPARIPQSQPYNERQSRNNAGGYAYTVDKWDQLDRFLIVGTQNGTYYVGQDKLTDECTALINACLAEDGSRTVQRLRSISEGGRAVKQDYAIYALALAIAFKQPLNIEVRSQEYQNYEQTVRVAYQAIPKVCRTASTLFQLISYLKHRKGWSRGLRNAIGHWYNGLPFAEKLAYQMVKYQSRHDFGQRDILRLAHVVPKDAETDALLNWATGGKAQPEHYKIRKGDVPNIVRRFEAAKTATPEERVKFASRLPREALPTEWLNDPDVWKALLMGSDDDDGRGMPLWAMLRNLGNMSKCGLLAADSPAARYVCGELRNDTRLMEARVHPISVLYALKTYASGRGFKGKGQWAPVGQVIDALNDAFVRSFRYLPKSDKKVCVAIDVSGSMSQYNYAESNLKPFEIAGAMALAHIRQYDAAFCVFATGWEAFKVSKDDTVERLGHRLAAFGGGGTDLGQAIRAAQAHVAPFDAIIIYTDNETWAGNRHLDSYWREYQRTRNANAKLVIASTVATNVTAGDPLDKSVLQAVGFDASVPQVIGDFLEG